MMNLGVNGFTNILKGLLLFKRGYSVVGEHIKSGIHPDTYMMLPDGSIVKAKDVNIHILAYDFSYISPTPVTTKKIMVLASKVISIRTLHSEKKVSRNHRLLVLSDNVLKVIRADQIKAGDFLAVPYKVKTRNEKYIGLPSTRSMPLHTPVNYSLDGGAPELSYDVKRKKGRLRNLVSLFFRKKQKAPRDVEEVLEKEEELHHISVLNEDLAQTIAFIKFSYTLVNNEVKILCKGKDVAKGYASSIRRIFRLKSKMYKHKSKRLWIIEFSRYGSIVVKHTIEHPNMILDAITRSPTSVVAAFISGIYDATGRVNKDSIELIINDIDLAFKLQLLMLRLGVYPYVTRDKETGLVKLKIRGRMNINNFINTVGKYSYQDIRIITRRDFDDIIPLTNSVKGLVESEAEISYLNGYYVVSREQLQRIIQNKYTKYYSLTSVRETLTEALYLLSFRWDPVIAIRVEEYDGPLYDFYVPLYHNYIAGPFVVYSSHTTLLSI